MTYNSLMNSWKKGFIHFFFFYILMLVFCANSWAVPRQDGFPHPPKDPDNIINYRGKRTYKNNLPLEVNKINCERVNEEFVSIMIFFNQSINPRSLHFDSFFINDIPLPADTRFDFNKRGDMIRIIIPIQNNSFKIKMQNISSFDGSVIEPMQMQIEVTR